LFEPELGYIWGLHTSINPHYSSSLAVLKPEIKEILDTCKPYRMIKNAAGYTDFYFMWAESLVRFKLSLDI
jgi:hypothetical protein